MFYSLSFLTVELMRQGNSPERAARAAIARIKGIYPKFVGAIVAATIEGQFGAACAGMEGKFGYSVVQPDSGEVRVEVVQCL